MDVGLHGYLLTTTTPHTLEQTFPEARARDAAVRRAVNRDRAFDQHRRHTGVRASFTAHEVAISLEGDEQGTATCTFSVHHHSLVLLEEPDLEGVWEMGRRWARTASRVLQEPTSELAQDARPLHCLEGVIGYLLKGLHAQRSVAQSSSSPWILLSRAASGRAEDVGRWRQWEVESRRFRRWSESRSLNVFAPARASGRTPQPYGYLDLPPGVFVSEEQLVHDLRTRTGLTRYLRKERR